MAKHDEWCELCDDKIKQVTITLRGREYHVCIHCKTLAVG